MRTLVLLLLLIAQEVSPQGLLKSRIIQGDSTKPCTLTVTNILEQERTDHIFRVSTSTYLLPGYYEIHYWMDTTWLHGEYTHITKKQTVLEKVVFEKRQPLGTSTFIKPKRVVVERYLEY